MSSLFDLPFEEPEDASALPEANPAPVKRRPLSVSELTQQIRGALEHQFAEVWVEGEISNCRRWQTGHIYFTLKDANAQLKAVMFKTAVRYLRFAPEDGLHVVARGQVSVYDPKGEYQLVCEHLEPHGLGALQLAFEQVKKRLAREGLFDAARRRPLPVFPRKIGIVTSLDGAALRDILKVLSRRYPNAHIVIRPARVLGEGAAGDLARAMKAIARVPGVDVVIVGRGGGSIEDLWAFNDEFLARTIAAAKIPVVSAVGHEVDFTIADFVADVRAPTPSAAAEIVVSRRDDFCGRVDALRDRARSAARMRLHRLRSRLHVLATRPAFANVPGRVAMRQRHVAELVHALRHAIREALARDARRLRSFGQRLEAADIRRRLQSSRASLAALDSRLVAANVHTRHASELALRTLAGRLEAMSPLAVLARGYAVCWNEHRSAILRSSRDAPKGSTVRVTLHEGELVCGVTESLARNSDDSRVRQQE
jgi:exodeoxyribonuclease VII large subunit